MVVTYQGITIYNYEHCRIYRSSFYLEKDKAKKSDKTQIETPVSKIGVYGIMMITFLMRLDGDNV